MAKKKKGPDTGVAMRYQPLEMRAVEGGSGQYEISFSSEQPYQRWFGNEVLDHSPGAVDLSRMGDVGTLLFAHGRDPKAGCMPIGKVIRAWVDEVVHQCRAVVEFDPDDEMAEKIRSKMEKGMLTGVSVGYNVSQWTSLREGEVSVNGRFTGPAEIAVKWMPYEISLEPTPADASVGFGKCMENEMEEREMDEDEKTIVTEKSVVAPVPVVTPVPTTPVTPTQKSGEEVERTRCAEITTLCRQWSVDAAPFISGGDSVDRVRTAILEKLSRDAAPVQTNGGSVTITKDAADKFRAAAVDGVLTRGGFAPEKPADGAREFAGMTLRAMAEECLEQSGVSGVRRMEAGEVLRRAMAPTSQFAGILSGVVNTAMATAYLAAPTTYQLWTGRGSASDFRPTEIFQISEAGDLTRIEQGGEFRFDEMDTSKMATRQLLTYGKSFGLTREAFINDNIDLITKMPQAYVRAARRGINRGVYNLLKNNPAMRDGNALFSATHKNLGTAAKIGTDSLAEALGMMRRQKNLKGNEVLNIAPKFMLLPSLLEVAGRQLLVSTSDPAATNSGVANVFQGLLTPIVDAELDMDNGAQPYYFAASPMDCDTIEVSYLNGQEMPILEMQADFDRLGYKFRIYIDYGISLVDHRGLVKNPGSN